MYRCSCKALCAATACKEWVVQLKASMQGSPNKACNSCSRLGEDRAFGLPPSQLCIPVLLASLRRVLRPQHHLLREAEAVRWHCHHPLAEAWYVIDQVNGHCNAAVSHLHAAWALSANARLALIVICLPQGSPAKGQYVVLLMCLAQTSQEIY